MNHKVGLLLISTGKYDQFLKPLLESVNNHFYPADEVNVFIFTDKPHIVKEFPQYDRIASLKAFFIEHKPFPYPTLYRYKYFTERADIIRESGCTMLYYVDVDALFIKDMTWPRRNDDVNFIYSVQHCGFANGGWGSNNVDERSTAYLEPELRECYFMGGLQGGSTDEYLKACKILSENIAMDEANGVMAEWHDESHWNFYMKKQTDYIYRYSSGPTMMMAEEMEGAHEYATILAMKKDHEAIRS